MSSIAIVGVSALFPGSTDAGGFWRDILAGRDLVTDVPPSHWLLEDYYDPDPAAPDKTYSKRGAFLGAVDFDPMEFGVPPNILPATDTAQLLALIVVQKVLEDATQGQFSDVDRERTSVILGVTSGQELLGTMVSRLQRPVWLKALRESGIAEPEAQAICERIANQYVPWQESSFPGLLGNVVAGRIANRFNLHGTNCVTDAACASGLSALSMAVNELAVGQSDLVIAGGVDTMNDILMYVCFSKTPALSPTGDCRPFADDADGTLLGEGLAMFALRRLEDAERDGNRIYAVIRGVGSSSDGRAKSVYAPVPEGQARALRRAYQQAGYGPDTVELVEAHGTATKAGDAAELAGLQLVFGESGRSDRQWCALGSVKSQIGHTKAAAGAAGLFKAVMALHHKTLPPTIKVTRPNGKLALEDSAFYINTRTRPWIRDRRHPRRASVSSFGFGGSNFHVALEEYVGAGKPAFRLRTAPTELVLLSARSAEALAARCREAATAARDTGLVASARASQETFRAGDEARLAVVASNAEEAATKLILAGERLAADGARVTAMPGVHVAVGAAAPGRIAFLFPGQGSQYVGMGGEVAAELAGARAVWDAAAATRFDGLAPHDVVFPVPAFSDAEREAQLRRLTATEWAQPAIGVASLALLEVLRAAGVKPDCVGGHSFGEVTALCAAGMFDAAALVSIARKRGELMRDAATVPGAMIAVPKAIAEVRALVEELAGNDIVIANHNHPAQVVLSGPLEAVSALEAKLADKGIAARRLAVATAFHSPLVSSASAPLAAFLSAVPAQAITVEVYSNAEAGTYPADPAAARACLAEQLVRPVRFVEQIEAMWLSGVRLFVEVGPGAVLTEFVTRILDNRPHAAIATDRKGRHGVTSLQEALGRLAVAGVALDLASLWADCAPAPAAKRKPAMTVPILGSNYGKIYPPAGGAAALPAPVLARLEPARVVPSPLPSVLMPEPAAQPLLSNEAQGDWVRAYQETQRHLGEAHAAYQRAMAETHLAFLKTTESSFSGLSSLLGGAPLAPPTVEAPPIAAPTPTPTPAPPPPAPTPPPVIAPAMKPQVDLESLLLAVVAEKTGYPVEMLKLDMELEADLGIDSIKRVEILSAIRERAPALPEVVASEMAALRTLGQIIAHLRAHNGVAPATAATATAAPRPAIELEPLLLSVVAEKTGYPVEMLKLDMELEADLGIDSIKRVEILSAIRERAPALPEVVASEMAALRTLGQIIAHLRAHNGVAPAPTATSTATVTPAHDLEPLLLAVVAEKTGYPAEMLKLDMELEADLGIDSIKRVEILSAIRERAPSLPEVAANEMAALRTLGQIIAHLRAHGGGGVTSAATAPAAEIVIATPAIADAGVQRYVQEELELPSSGLAPAALLAGEPVVITDDGGGIAVALARELGARGVAASVVARVSPEARAIVFLGGLRAIAGIDAALAVADEAFATAKTAAARLASGGLFVTVQDTGGDFGLTGRGEPGRAWLGGLAALARTAALEWPRATVKAIDLERGDRAPDVIAAVLARELVEGGGPREVGLRADGKRITLGNVTRAIRPGSTVVDEHSVLVVSGGARGVTAAAVVALAERSRARFVLLGRTPLVDEPDSCRDISDELGLKRALLEIARKEGRSPTPLELSSEVARVVGNREVRATLAAIERAGGQAWYLPVDVQDGARLAAALETVRAKWGALTGLVHGAGVLADKLIADKSPEQFARVFATKVQGLRALLDATAADPLTLIVLFSSVAARTGNPGQCDYAMANEVLNHVAVAERRRRGGACVVKAIGWGPWEGGMVTPSLRAHMKERGVPLIPLAEGARRFVAELEGSPDEVVTVIGKQLGDGALGAPMQAKTEPSVELSIKVDRDSHPYLSDHAVGGAPVLPMVMAVEWFVRAARSLAPELPALEVHNVRVLRGVRLERFETGGELLTVHCQPRDKHFSVELRGRNGARHYSAELRPAAPGNGHARPRPSGMPVLEPWPKRATYDGHILFHGPRFQMIRAIEGVSAEGMAGALAGMGELDWGGVDWQTDPVALDGALQLAGLWACHVLGGATLPMAFASYHCHGHRLLPAPLRCVVYAGEVHAARAVCDVALFDGDGRIVAELTGVENIVRPGELAAVGGARAV